MMDWRGILEDRLFLWKGNELAATMRATVAKRLKGRKEGTVALTTSLPEGYSEFFEQVRVRVLQAQTQAAFAVNRELLHLY